MQFRPIVQTAECSVGVNKGLDASEGSILLRIDFKLYHTLIVTVFINKAGYTAFGAPKHLYNKRRYGPTNGRTDGRTDPLIGFKDASKEIGVGEKKLTSCL